MKKFLTERGSRTPQAMRDKFQQTIVLLSLLLLILSLFLYVLFNDDDLVNATHWTHSRYEMKGGLLF